MTKSYEDSFSDVHLKPISHSCRSDGVCKCEQPVVKESLTVQKPLSDEEIFNLCPYEDAISEEAFYRGARAIEKAHGIGE